MWTKIRLEFIHRYNLHVCKFRVSLHTTVSFIGEILRSFESFMSVAGVGAGLTYATIFTLASLVIRLAAHNDVC